MSNSEKASARDLALLNNENRIIVLSCKDPEHKLGIKKFVCVPTRVETIPGKYVPSLLANPKAVSLMKRMERLGPQEA